jgi:phosphoglycerate dehydrogenase-like enzyme
VLAHDPFVEATMGEAFGAELVTFEALFTRSAFLSVHLPLNSATHHIVDSRALSLLRPEAQLINTSRGAVVDQEALVRALDEGLLGGAGLDVLEREPPELSDRLIGRPNVLISPHSAALTEEALGELGRSAVLDVLRVLRGEPPLHAVSEPG